MDAKRITLTAIVAVLTALGGMFAYSVDWAIKTQARLGVSQTQADSLFKSDSLIIRRLKRIERALGIKSGSQSLPQVPKQEGLARRIWHLIF